VQQHIEGVVGLSILFHKVVWQRMIGVVGFLNNHFTANLLENEPETVFEKRLNLTEITPYHNDYDFLWNTV